MRAWWAGNVSNQDATEHHVRPDRRLAFARRGRSTCAFGGPKDARHDNSALKCTRIRWSWSQIRHSLLLHWLEP